MVEHIIYNAGMQMKNEIRQHLKSFETPTQFCYCVICHRLTSKGHTELLFTDGMDEIRVCARCNHA